MDAGRLRHRIDLEERVVTRDTEGGEIVSWVLWAAAVPAEVAPASGKEMMVGGAELGQVTTRIVIRWRPGVVPTMRAIHRQTIFEEESSTIYNIVAQLPDPETGRVSITLLCNTGANNG